MSNIDFGEALAALAQDKGISVDTLLGALADALESAYKRMPGAHEYAWVTIDPDTFEFRVFAQEIDEDGEPYGDEIDVTPDDFGRIAAQTARQVMTQRIREAEREHKYEEYAGREGDIVTGIIQQNDSRYTLLDLGRVEALLPQAEQVPYERPAPNTRLKAYIVEVRRTAKGPQIVVSRTHPGLILELFKLEVPEIADGVVELKACAREPGHRTKIAVWSNDTNVDPVGACVGARGARVRMVVNELRGEKIDIVPFSDDPPDFVMKALSPAKVKEVRIDVETGTATVIVPDFQLSLAIGKEGQNARLAARLTGWRRRHQERDAAGRRGGVRRRGVGPGRVGRRPRRPVSRSGCRPRAARLCRPTNGPTPATTSPPRAAQLRRRRPTMPASPTRSMGRRCPKASPPWKRSARRPRPWMPVMTAPSKSPPRRRSSGVAPADLRRVPAPGRSRRAGAGRAHTGGIAAGGAYTPRTRSLALCRVPPLRAASSTAQRPIPGAASARVT